MAEATLNPKEEPSADAVAIAAFLKEYGELVAKHKVDIVAYPMYQPDGQGSWNLHIQTRAISTREQPVKSPFVPQG